MRGNVIIICVRWLTMGANISRHLGDWQIHPASGQWAAIVRMLAALNTQLLSDSYSCSLVNGNYLT